VRVDRALGELLAERHWDAIGNTGLQARAPRDLVCLLVALFVGDDEVAGLVGVLDPERAGDLGKDRLALGLACLEELRDTRQTVGDVLARDTTGVEGTHGELRARLADRLGGDDADGSADVDGLAGGEIPAVAHLADAVPRMARHDRAGHDRLDACVGESEQLGFVGQELPCLLDDLAGLRVLDRLEQAAADEVRGRPARCCSPASARRLRPRRFRSRSRGR
jgi:hypothetical protein